jgi:hypothetical protein
MSQPKLNYDQLLLSAAYDPSKPEEPEIVVLRMDNQTIGSLGNFVTLSGLHKHGKGKYISAIAASGINRKEVFGLITRLPENKRRIAYFDTDQGKNGFNKTINLIKQLAETESIPAHFEAYHVRKFEARIIKEVIRHYITTKNDLGLLLIDNIGDLTESFNDDTGSRQLTDFLKNVTDEHNILAVLTLHLGKTTGNTLGHLGSFLDRYSQTVLKTEKNKETRTFILTVEFGRDCEPGEITPSEIYFDKYDYRWKQQSYTPKPDDKVKSIQARPRDYDKEDHRRKVLRIFNSQEVISYDDLLDGIQQQYPNVGLKWAREAVIVLQDESVIWPVTGGFTNINRARLFIQQ